MSGDKEFDNSDAKKLLPLEITPRLVAMTISNNIPLKINNLPLYNEEPILIPLDILVINSDSLGYFTTIDSEVSLFDVVSDLPNHISINLLDNLILSEIDITSSEGLNLFVESTGSFNPSTNEIIKPYPTSEISRYALIIRYNSLEDDHSVLPKKFELHQNYPNPFNPITTIKFDLPKESKVNIFIYDVLGRITKKLLINSQENIGFKSILWDARDDNGKKVPAGVYFYKIQAGNFNQTKKDDFTEVIKINILKIRSGYLQYPLDIEML